MNLGLWTFLIETRVVKILKNSVLGLASNFEGFLSDNLKKSLEFLANLSLKTPQNLKKRLALQGCWKVWKIGGATLVLYFTCQNIGGANKGAPILIWQKLVVL